MKLIWNTLLFLNAEIAFLVTDSARPSQPDHLWYHPLGWSHGYFRGWIFSIRHASYVQNFHGTNTAKQRMPAPNPTLMWFLLVNWPSEINCSQHNSKIDQFPTKTKQKKQSKTKKKPKKNGQKSQTNFGKKDVNGKKHMHIDWLQINTISTVKKNKNQKQNKKARIKQSEIEKTGVIFNYFSFVTKKILKNKTK